MLFESEGTLQYSVEPQVGFKLIVSVPQQLSNYYFSLIPSYKNVNRQFYPAHISVVRKETPTNLEAWGKHHNQRIKFLYENWIYSGTVYYWLNCFSQELEDIRLELGLPVSSQYTLPPAGFVKCFHMTLANTKKK